MISSKGPRASGARALALVGGGGALGTVARVALAGRFPVADDAFPWTTFMVNVLGAFALALLLTVLTERLRADRDIRLFLGTGALGAFTTYSTLSTELAGRLGNGHVVLALGYVAATLVCGLAAAFAGVMVARRGPRAGAIGEGPACEQGPDATGEGPAAEQGPDA